jgi:EAL domain-containing protein (putative c-di-GMP-specific phosphodiesterase class I)
MDDPQSALFKKMHQRRVLHLLWTSVGVLAGLGGFWSVVFTFLGRWDLVGVELVLFCTAAGVAWLTHQRRTRLAWSLVLVVSYVALCLISIYFDGNDSVAPRTSHLYLLVLLLASMLVFRHEPPWLRWGTVAVLLATFIVFASSIWPHSSALFIPAPVRLVGSWINAASAMLGLLALMHILLQEGGAGNALERDIDQGLARAEFYLVYQPQVQRDGGVVGAEALLRWQHPKFGPVSPAEFIPVAEQSGHILALGAWVLSEACQTLVQWAKQPGLSQLTLSVNVSARQFLQPDFVEQVGAMIHRARIPPSRLKLELTEGSLIHDLEDVAGKMHQLRALGVGCALDDFGTGFSSLGYLRKLPLDQLKIDQTFVRDVLADEGDAAIARTVLELGRNLGLSVVAEGVETAGQRDFLLANHCQYFQGYLFSRPLGLRDFDSYALAHGVQALPEPQRATT